MFEQNPDGWRDVRMQLLVEVMFYSDRRKNLPTDGYCPDAVFDGCQEYWGITFVALSAEKFDTFTPAVIRFTFDGSHYREVTEGQIFRIMEGPKQVGEGKIFSIED